jgi:hypothetical protein
MNIIAPKKVFPKKIKIKSYNKFEKVAKILKNKFAKRFSQKKRNLFIWKTFVKIAENWSPLGGCLLQNKQYKKSSYHLFLQLLKSWKIKFEIAKK